MIPDKEFERDNCFITTDMTKIDTNDVHSFLSRSYWANQRTLETVELSMSNSLCFGMLEEEKLIGFARVITDYATFAYLCDVYIDEDYRGRGLGKWMIESILSYDGMGNLRRWLLATKDAHGLYSQYGFALLGHPDRFMEKFNPDAR